MSSWTEVGKPDEPVRGDIAAFDKAVTQWRSAYDKAEQIRTDFEQIIGRDASVGLEGAAADAFREFVKDTKSLLDDVPQVFESMAGVLSGHLSKLNEYKNAADIALGKALAAKESRRVASSQAAAANARAATLKRQIQDLKAQLPETSAAQIVTLERQLSVETSTQRTRATEAANSQSDLENALKQWDVQRSNEDSLNKETAKSLQHFDLRSLRDPSWLQQQYDAFKTFFAELGHDLWGVLEALFNGDLDQALWHLRGVLDKLSKIVEVLQFIVLIVGAIAIVATGGAAIPFVIAAMKGLAVANAALSTSKALVTGYLVAGQVANKETGEVLGVSDFVFDGIDAGFAIASAITALKMPTPSRAGPLKYNTFRKLLKEETGVTFKRGYDVSVKRTAKEAGKRTLEEVYEDDEVRDAISDIGGDGNLWSGTSSDLARRRSIANGIDAIRNNPQRGISVPFNAILVGTY